MTPWTFWMVLAAILAVAEMMTGTFYLLVLAGAAVAGAAAAYTGAVSWVQIIIVAVVAVAGFAALHKYRPQTTRAAASANPDVNPDIGAIVRIAQLDAHGAPRVAYRGTEWSARVDNGAPQMGIDYRVSRVDGAILILEPLN